MGDEYVPSHVDKDLLVHNLVTAMGDDSTRPLKIASANHNLSTPIEAAEEFVSATCTFLKEVS